jgi:predicted amidophosphoribosyltransferase
MLGKTCPHCKERVKKDALVCRYCGRELEPNNEVFGYWKERRRWREDITDYSLGEEFNNEEF